MNKRQLAALNAVWGAFGPEVLNELITIAARRTIEAAFPHDKRKEELHALLQTCMTR